MSNDKITTTTLTFEGREIAFKPDRLDPEWWVTSDQAAAGLGYKTQRQVIRLYNRHSDEFTGADSTVVRSTTVDGKVRSLRAFSTSGLELLAMLGRTEVCKRFRLWLRAVALPALRKTENGAIAEQLAALAERFVALESMLMSERLEHQRALNAERARCFSALEDGLARSHEISKIQASAIASALGKRGALKRIEKALRDEVKAGQQLMFTNRVKN